MAITTIELKVKSLAAAQLNLSPSKILNSSGWRELGANSLSYTQFILSLEKEFNVKISDQTAASFKTFNDVIGHLTSLGVSPR
jgi:acyl carrier protein